MNFFKSKPDANSEPATEKAPTNAAFPDMGDDKGLEEHVSADPANAAPSVEDLSKRFDEYKEASEARETRLLDALTNASAPAVPVAPAYSTAEEFKPADLPDAVEDPEGYARVLQENIQGNVKHLLESQSAEATRNNSSATTYDGMWDEFQNKYEDLAQHEELVEIHAGRVAKILAGQGIDVPTYMVQNRDKFLGDVAKSVGDRLVALGLGPKDDGTERPDPMLDPNRTGGLPGTGTASAPVKDDAAPTQGGFINEIHKSQKDMGLI